MSAKGGVLPIATLLDSGVACRLHEVVTGQFETFDGAARIRNNLEAIIDWGGEHARAVNMQFLRPQGIHLEFSKARYVRFCRSGFPGLPGNTSAAPQWVD